MLLVPKQLQRTGMTGDVPYYGGRLTPEQAYAASHPTRRPSPPPPGHRADAIGSLQYLLDTGVITRQEYTDLRARMGV